MPKEYFCEKILPNGIICAERDKTKFISGRYTTCKSCRLSKMSDYNRSKTNKKKDDEAEKEDPDCNIRYLIEDTIKRVPFSRQQTILEKIENSEEDITEVLNLHHEFVNKTETKIENMQKEIEELKLIIKNLKDEFFK
jgi:hypothetical protein